MTSHTLESPARASHCDSADQLVEDIREAIQHCGDFSEMLVYLSIQLRDDAINTTMKNDSGPMRVWAGVGRVHEEIMKQLLDAQEKASDLNDIVFKITNGGAHES
jgi:hypothetical protein